ncbi:hypothetical protein Ahy_A10g046821 [Arachis hypogaea]|uniref:Uncharacterized protein n=1 Tax=Arachis hypogaea TaxID=3818 RepID=A0A445B0M7_ARAHY|nr:hypothetical protein Ahy_A10g046821 [Arachis hypogaea]
MSAMVEAWMWELTKLREKVVAPNNKAKEEKAMKRESQKEMVAVQREFKFAFSEILENLLFRQHTYAFTSGH